MKEDLFISVDIETDGPIPGENSMLSLGAAAIHNYTIVDTFSVNLEQLEGAEMNPDTKREFWDKFPEAWEACRKNLVHPKHGMQDLVNWVKALEKKHGRKATFVAYPAGFDFTFSYWYLMKFAGQSPFSFSALDMKTLAMALLHQPNSKKHSYRGATKRRFPKAWFSKRPHTHIALDDALEQADLFISMLKALDQRDEVVTLMGRATGYSFDKKELANALELFQGFLDEGEV
jgi:DNA polymerase III alpha subunit (gram-positive type)